MQNISKSLGRRIRALREESGMSQEQLAAEIGLLRVTLSQIENGERTVKAEDIVKLALAFNISADHLLDLQKPPIIILPVPEKPLPTAPQERIHVPQKNLAKFKEVFLYILNKVGSKPHIGETVIYKLLYFIDFDYYERYEEQIIGATYLKNHHGPTPIEFKKIVELMIKEGSIEKVNSRYFSYPQTKYLPRRTPDFSALNARELQLIDEVLCRLSDKNAAEISEYSHKDIPWLTAESGKAIEYESVFYRTEPYSMRPLNEQV